ncbi:hypothetical protein BH11ARM2_BH11ARM2_34880 [soil metagenome]
MLRLILPTTLRSLVNAAEPVESITTMEAVAERRGVVEVRCPSLKNRPRYEVELQDWIAPLVAELDEETEAANMDAPEIIEDYQGFSDRFSVRVVWSRWEGVPPADRVPIILEAYRRSRRAGELPNITLARGLFGRSSAKELRRMAGTHRSA